MATRRRGSSLMSGFIQGGGSTSSLFRAYRAIAGPIEERATYNTSPVTNYSHWYRETLLRQPRSQRASGHKTELLKATRYTSDLGGEIIKPFLLLQNVESSETRLRLRGRPRDA
ncbi:hypothetical protein J6590_088079 [Homalodisca vitripennis]|nr:hypothetical protein J6590_088079 [Homalodisca vitripennis]